MTPKQCQNYRIIQTCFYITSLIQTTPEYTIPENFAKIGRVVSEHER